MRVLGVDPGSLHTGYGVIEEISGNFHIIASGCIDNNSKDPFTTRYNNIFSELSKIIQQTNPDVIALENVIYCNNTAIAIKLGEARGIAILTAGQFNLPIAQYAPKKIKQAAVGFGGASKIQVQNMIKQLLNMDTLPQPDTADALAAAICHLNYIKTELKKVSL